MAKIALIGSANSVVLAPYEDSSFQSFRQGLPTWPEPPFRDESWEIWGCSPGAAQSVRRATRWFEVHRWEPGQAWFNQGYCQFLREFKGPVYVGGEPGQIPLEEVPNQVPYPLDAVDTEFSTFFLTSSLALMAGVAILEIEAERARDPEHDDTQDVLGFWGVDMAANEEYGFQRPGCHYFILEALRRGIGIYVPPESCLLRPQPVYGLSEWQHNYIKLTQRSRELNARVKAAAEEKAKKEQEIYTLAGALDDLNYMVNTWTSPHGLEAGKVIRLNRQGRERRGLDEARAPETAPTDVAVHLRRHNGGG